MWNVFKKAVGSAAREVKADYSQNRDFLEAVVAACALVSYADGELEDSERLKAARIIKDHPLLGKTYQSNVIEETIETLFKRAKDRSGRNQLFRELGDIKGRPDSKQMAEDAYLVALDIAEADGEIETEEQAVLTKIAGLFGLDEQQLAG